MKLFYNSYCVVCSFNFLTLKLYYKSRLPIAEFSVYDCIEYCTVPVLED